MPAVLSVIIWLNLALPGIVSLYVLSPGQAAAVVCLETSIILIVYGFPAIPARAAMSMLSVLAPFNAWYVWTFHTTLTSEILQFCLSMSFQSCSEFLLSVLDSGVFLTTIAVSAVLGLLCWRKNILATTRQTRQALFAVGLLSVSILALDGTILAPALSRLPLMPMSLAVSAFPVNILHAIGKKILPIVHAETGQAVVAVKISREDETDQETVVYVIGESARADHWHKNGYGRETTPFIDAEKVINFPNVRSISDCTSLTVPGLFGMFGAEQLHDLNVECKADTALLQAMPGHASLFDYFRGAGFFTSAIISFNQSVLPITSVGAKLDHIELTDADTLQYDTLMLPNFYRELERPFKKKLIVLHTYGSHWQYRNRYPARFNIFKDNSSQFSEHMAHYDNSIAATDSFLHDVLEKLKTVQGKVVLVYTSDHGEGDGKKMEVHCSVPSNHTTLVPLFFWTKGKVSSEKLKVLNENSSRYVSQDLVAATLLDLVGITSETLDVSRALTRGIAPAAEYYTYGYNKKLYSCTLEKCLEVD